MKPAFRLLTALPAAPLAAFRNGRRRGTAHRGPAATAKSLTTMRTIATLLLTTATASCCLGADGAVTLESLLTEMIDRDAVARWPAPAFVSHQASSYDRHSKSPNLPGWFSNSDYSQFIRNEKRADRTEWVMMDADGPGCITRIWTGGKPATGMVRLYLDGADTPVISGQLQDLLCGRSFVHRPLAIENPKQAGNLWLPIPYARHCKVTYEEINPKIPGGPPPLRWYNIEYRTYPAGTLVKSFSMADFQAAQPVLETVRSALAGGSAPSGGVAAACVIDRVIGPGEQAAVDLPPGNATLRRLELYLENADAQALRSTVLRAEFDGEETIWCPVGDFFGSGVGVNALESWTRTATKDGAMTCRWVMPYKTSARLSLVNLGKQKVAVKLSAASGSWTWDDRSMHFHANWRQQESIPSRPFSDWNYLTTSGKGVYVGDVLCVFNPLKKWFGEGDEKIWVDGESFPSHFGTGTEDYYCFAWGLTGLTQGPFANLVRSDDPRLSSGHTVVTRTRSLDTIPFSKSLQFDMEIWHWGDCKVCYAVATYWYALPGATSDRPPTPDEAARPLHDKPEPLLRNAVECERMQIVAKSADLATGVQSAGLSRGEWSEGAQLFVRGRRAGDFVELRFPAKEKCKLTLYATKSWDYGILRFSVNGQRAGADYDAWAEKPAASGPITLGVFEPKDGGFVLRVEVVGANPKSKNSQSFFGLDAVTVTAP